MLAGMAEKYTRNIQNCVQNFVYLWTHAVVLFIVWVCICLEKLFHK